MSRALFPFASALARRHANALLTTALVIALTVTVVDVTFLLLGSRSDRQAQDLTARIGAVAQDAARDAAAAAKGDPEAFATLQSHHDTVADAVGRLTAGDPGTGMRAYADGRSSAIGAQTADLERAWTRMDKDLAVVRTGKDATVAATAKAAALAQGLPLLNGQARQILDDLRGTGTYDQAAALALLMEQADRLTRRARGMLDGTPQTSADLDALAHDAGLYDAGLKALVVGLPAGSPAAAVGTQMQTQWAALNEQLRALAVGSTAVNMVRQAAARAPQEAQDVLVRAHDMGSAVADAPLHRVFPNVWWALLGGASALALMGALVRRSILERNRRAAVETERGVQQQHAIMRLLDEMGALAEGDLTVTTTVSEDVTGAIADSVNYAIYELRHLVTRINETSEQVSSSSQDTQGTAQSLSDSAQQQARRITSATDTINGIATMMDEIAQNSSESAEVAERSVTIANRGAQVVRDTISGMDAIRDQIQETSKRIKRLGETSQEITTVVELITDIAEQTNILAINAAIQAASSGATGHGFAVVADEVQRLAERTANAIKRVEALVLAIQSDTNEAVESMERTTSEVVTGARKAEDAGGALDDIERVSHDLSHLIARISQQAREQSQVAGLVSQSMNAIQEITTTTATGAQQTSALVGEVARLAGDLRKSVAHFKLPE